jgi:hypothetical protein
MMAATAVPAWPEIYQTGPSDGAARVLVDGAWGFAATNRVEPDARARRRRAGDLAHAA